MTQAELLNLQNGICNLNQVAPVTAIVVNQTSDTNNTCAEPTQAVLLDASKISQSQCPSVFMDLTNNSGAPVTLVFGAFGNPNERFLNYESALTPPSATDVAGVLDNEAPAAAANNAPSLQRFNFLVRTTNVIAKSIQFRLGTAPVAGQSSQSLRPKNYTFDTESNCNGRRIAPACNTCFNNNDDQVVTFQGPYVISDMKALWYELATGQRVLIDIELGSIASAKGFVPCTNSTNA